MAGNHSAKTAKTLYIYEESEIETDISWQYQRIMSLRYSGRHHQRI